jgi:hypothetical protein
MGWNPFPVQGGLTRMNFLKMRAISKDPTVQSCWGINGSLRFRLKDSTTVKKCSLSIHHSSGNHLHVTVRHYIGAVVFRIAGCSNSCLSFSYHYCCAIPLQMIKTGFYVVALLISFSVYIYRLISYSFF